MLLNELNDVLGNGNGLLEARNDLSFCSDLDDLKQETKSDSFDGINFEGSPSMRKSNKKKKNENSNNECIIIDTRGKDVESFQLTPAVCLDDNFQDNFYANDSCLATPNEQRIGQDQKSLENVQTDEVNMLLNTILDMHSRRCMPIRKNMERPKAVQDN